MSGSDLQKRKENYSERSKRTEGKVRSIREAFSTKQDRVKPSKTQKHTLNYKNGLKARWCLLETFSGLSLAGSNLQIHKHTVDTQKGLEASCGLVSGDVFWTELGWVKLSKQTLIIDE